MTNEQNSWITFELCICLLSFSYFCIHICIFGCYLSNEGLILLAAINHSSLEWKAMDLSSCWWCLISSVFSLPRYLELDSLTPSHVTLLPFLFWQNWSHTPGGTVCLFPALLLLLYQSYVGGLRSITSFLLFTGFVDCVSDYAGYPLFGLQIRLLSFSLCTVSWSLADNLHCCQTLLFSVLLRHKGKKVSPSGYLLL